MLQEVSLENYQNLSIPRLKLTGGTIILVGNNSQGKTNILEAIHLLSYGRPFRGTKIDAINWAAQSALIIGKTEREQISICLNKNKETKILLNSKVKGLIDLFGKFVSVLFHPAEIETASGPPNLRRAWLDKTVATSNKAYLVNLINYQKALRNRNRLLKSKDTASDVLEPWDRALAKFGSKIWIERSKSVVEINKLLKALSARTIGKTLRLGYRNPILEEELDKTEVRFLHILGTTRRVEQRVGTTVFGPHRDDFRFIIEEEAGSSIVEKDAALYGSRGEQRQCVVMLKLAEAAFLNKVFGRPPTILLDDVLSELDAANRSLLLANLRGSQVIITTTDVAAFEPEIKKKAKIMFVKQGKVQTR